MRLKVVEEARKWLGTPYHHQAMVPGAGADCLTFLIGVYSGLGLIPADIAVPEYSTNWHLHSADGRYLDGLLRYAEPTVKPEAGDIAVWKFGRAFSHGGIVTGGGGVIHCYVTRGVVFDDIEHSELAGRDVKFFHVKGV